MTDVQNGVPVTSIPTVSSTIKHKSVLPSVLLGLPAGFFQARNAKKNGLSTKRYWIASFSCTFAVVLLIGVLAIVAGLSSSNKRDAADPSINTGAGNNQPANTTPQLLPLNLPTESITDSPQQIANELSAVLSSAFVQRDARYLDHFYGPDNKTSGGYAKSLSIVQSGGQFTFLPATNVSATDITPGNMMITFNLNVDSGATSVVTAHVVFINGEWLTE